MKKLEEFKVKKGIWLIRKGFLEEGSIKAGGEGSAGPTATSSPARLLATSPAALASEAFTGGGLCSVSTQGARLGEVPWVVVK